MDLKKFLPSQDNHDSVEYYWALIIEPGWTQAGIWRISGSSAQVLKTSSSYPWEVDEELVNATDSALSSAIQGFPEGQDEPSKTVFGVIPSWVSEGQIKDEYLEKIKRVCSDLSLTPIGFVVIPESISHYIKSQEGSPINAVFVGLYKDMLEVSVFKLGNLLGSTTVTRSLSIIDDLAEGMSRFTRGEALPSRILLYDGKEGELTEAKNALSEAAWTERSDVQFLHTPKIEVFSPTHKVEAICLAGASEVAGITTLDGAAPLPPSALEEIPSDAENVKEVSAQDMGFVHNDIEQAGFEAPMVAQSEILEEEPIETKNEEEPEAKENTFPLKTGMHNPFTKLHFKPQIPKTFIIAIVVFLVVVVSGFIAWWYVPKATVTVYISPRMLDERIDIQVDPSGTTRTETKTLKGDVMKLSVEGERTKETTGIKTIGDKATGEVTLYRVGSKINLKAGTLLTGPQKLKFILNEDVEVASGSASTPGTTNAKVQAEAIGSDYNLASNTSFTVGNYTSSDIEAKNSESFSGGTSQEIAAVSSDDQKNLETDLTDELKEQAKEELLTTIPETSILIDDSLTVSSSTKTFNHKVGDEATNLKLSLSLNTEVIVVDRAELFALSQEAVKEKIPSGFVLREDQIETSFSVKKKEGSAYIFDVLVSANLLPQVDTLSIAEKIKGKYPTLAQDYLIKEVPGFARAEILLSPKLPGKLGTLPHVSKNIDVEVAAER